MQTLLDFLGDVLTWIMDLTLWVPRKVFGLLLDALGDWIATLQLPAAVQNGLSALGGLPSDVLWFLSVMQFGPGLTMVMAALVARFLLRRIPFIG